MYYPTELNGNPAPIDFVGIKKLRGNIMLQFITLRRFAIVTALVLSLQAIVFATQHGVIAFLSITPEDVIQWLTPVLVFGVTALVVWVRPLLPGWAILVLVQALIQFASWLTGFLDGELSFVLRAVAGLALVGVNEFIRQLTQGNTQTVNGQTVPVTVFGSLKK